MRSLYLGQIKGMLAVQKSQVRECSERQRQEKRYLLQNEVNAEAALIDLLEADFERAAKSGNNEELTQSVMLLTALFVALGGTEILYKLKKKTYHFVFRNQRANSAYSDPHPTAQLHSGNHGIVRHVLELAARCKTKCYKCGRQKRTR